MKEWLLLAFKNLFRNRRRTLLTSLVIGMGLFSLIMQNAIFEGLKRHMIEKATGNLIGDGQIHHLEFLPSFEADKTVGPSLFPLLESSPLSFAPRSVSLGMVSSAKGAEAAIVYGIDPEKEIKVTSLKKHLKGDFLTSQDSILLGSRLQKLLDVNENDHVVLTLSSKSGELIQERFKISGILYFNEPSMDSMAFIPLATSQKLLGIGNNFHEIVLRFTKAPPLLSKEIQPPYELLGYRELIPSLSAIVELSNLSSIIVMAIVFLLVIFIILNSLFMSLFERMKEFGVLKALGTTPSRLFTLILFEAGFLALISLLFGLLLSGLLFWILSYTGIDYTGIEMGGITIDEPIYPLFQMQQITLFPLAIFLFTLIASCYPAAVAAKIIPIKALQKEL